MNQSRSICLLVLVALVSLESVASFVTFDITLTDDTTPLLAGNIVLDPGRQIVALTVEIDGVEAPAQFTDTRWTFRAGALSIGDHTVTVRMTEDLNPVPEVTAPLLITEPGDLNSYPVQETPTKMGTLDSNTVVVWNNEPILLSEGWSRMHIGGTSGGFEAIDLFSDSRYSVATIVGNTLYVLSSPSCEDIATFWADTFDMGDLAATPLTRLHMTTDGVNFNEVTMSGGLEMELPTYIFSVNGDLYAQAGPTLDWLLANPPHMSCDEYFFAAENGDALCGMTDNLWRSTDGGSTWSVVSTTAFADDVTNQLLGFNNAYAIDDVTFAGKHFVLTGVDPRNDLGLTTNRLFSSGNGSVWQSVDLIPDTIEEPIEQVTSISVFKDQLYAAVRNGVITDQAPSPGEEINYTGPIATIDRGDRIMRTSDGVTWEIATEEIDVPASLEATDDYLIAFSYSLGSGPGPPAITISHALLSQDGTEWTYRGEAPAELLGVSRRYTLFPRTLGVIDGYWYFSRWETASWNQILGDPVSSTDTLLPSVIRFPVAEWAELPYLENLRGMLNTIPFIDEQFGFSVVIGNPTWLPPNPGMGALNGFGSGRIVTRHHVHAVSPFAGPENLVMDAPAFGNTASLLYRIDTEKPLKPELLPDESSNLRILDDDTFTQQDINENRIWLIDLAGTIPIGYSFEVSDGTETSSTRFMRGPADGFSFDVQIVPDGTPIDVPDENLAQAFRDQLNANDEPITNTSGRIDNFVELANFSGLGISDLTGMEWLTLFLRVDISGNPFTDLTPLSGLTAMEHLNLAGTPVSDLTPIRGLASLRSIDLEGTNVADINTLGEFWDLKGVDLSNTPVSDFSVLATLPDLESVALRDNELTDLSFLQSVKGSGGGALKLLDLRSNAISDLSVFASAKVASHLLLSNNAIEDVSDLRTMVESFGGQDVYIDLIGNPLSEGAVCDDIPAIEATGAVVDVSQTCPSVVPPPVEQSQTVRLRGRLINSTSDTRVTCGAIELTSMSDSTRYASAADKQGFYYFDSIPQDVYTVALFGFGFREQDGGAIDLTGVDEVEQNFMLDPADVVDASIQGQVRDVDTGEPLPGVLVEAMAGATVVGRTYSCSAGDYRIEVTGLKGLPIDVMVSFSINNYEPIQKNVQVTPGQETVADVPLKKSVAAVATLGGRVLAESQTDSTPLAGAEVIMRGTVTAAETCDEDGVYVFDSVPSGAYTIQSAAEGYEPKILAVSVPAAGAANKTIVLHKDTESPSDIDGNGSLTASDVQLVINAVLGLPIGSLNADVTSDRALNATDIQTVINAVLGNG